ncbi:RNA polymerase sigma-70 factor [Zhouia spongiae]|uniref:RNA polymerase sigma-70 factor n=1 Tax=Zhouia spongiae TaxID=2202721 RepID=A0ABY3YIW1_9FLAO|nr:RNA polymerase sigma-70 factor [Zhouia spongiae]UNY97528.1 RNA polymerase sigma-70 factor [Zhouia spongiae]
MRKNFLDINNQCFINLLREGDDEAHELLYRLYYDKLLLVANSYLNNKEDAEEIIHDVFVKLWRKKNELTIKSSVNSYLYSMTKNFCLDHLRKNKRRLSATDNIIQSEAYINFKALSDDISTKIIEEELEHHIQQAIASLPEKCREVFTKSKVYGLRHKEISEELDISIKTVENHMTKALKHMRLYLREYLPFL